ncbi:hypothetical protein D3C76_1703570 [compost metagenome]
MKQGIGLGKIDKRKKRAVEEEIQITISEVSEYVSQININPKEKTIEIQYTDGTRTFVSDNGIYY